MSKFRNAVAVLILCILAGVGYKKFGGNRLNLPADQDQLKDSVAQNPVLDGIPAGRSNHLTLSDDDQGELKDSLAESPALPQNGLGNGGNNGSQFNNGNFHGSNQPTRGSNEGGINPGGRYDPPQQLSPSGPR